MSAARIQTMHSSTSFFLYREHCGTLVRRVVDLLSSVAIFVFSSLFAIQLLAQPVNLTPEQLAQLQALTPEQRAALLQSAGSTQAVAVPAVPTEVAPRAVADSPAADEIERNARQVQGAEQLAEDVEQSNTTEPLRQFGYELFAGTPTTFAPANNIPVPLNYVVGPSDTVIIQLYGQRNARYEVPVSREGVLEFPEIGPLNVAGLTFEEMRDLINTTVATSLIGQQVSVTMGALRSIQIFVLGEAFRPGSYTVSSLSTMTNALFSSGGVTRVGSLRDIRLMRQGQLVTSLDLYDLLLRGDTSGDVRLQPNDVIFIPPIGRTLGIAGQVRRPAIFELSDEQTLEHALPLSGGYLPTAYPRASRIERINERGERTLLDVDLTQGANLALNVRDGDVLQIYSILDQVEGVVLLEGHVNRPGGFAWREGMRVTDILSSVGDMLPNPDLDYALIAREQQPNRTLEILYVNLRAALANPGSAADIVFQPRDRLLVFGAAQGRQAQLTGILNLLRQVASFQNPAQIVQVQGNVRFPGSYPLYAGMVLGNLIDSAGGLLENTDSGYSLLIRTVDEVGRIEPLAASAGAGTGAIIDRSRALQPGDALLVFNANQDRQELLAPFNTRLRSQADSNSYAQLVNVSGDVRFPGEFPLHQGLNVAGLIRAAGGLLQSAEPREAEITRARVDDVSGRELDHFAVNLTAAGPTGLNAGFQPFDTLVIRRLPNWTETQTVVLGGEVRSPGSYVIGKDETISEVIARAGGLTEFADPRAAIFLREDLRENEQALITEFREQLRQAILARNLNPTAREIQPTVSTEIFNELLSQVRATGRLVINLNSALEYPRSDADVLLERGDRLLVPAISQEITVLGEVQRPTSHLYDPNLDVGDYINKSGGLTQNANNRGVYVIKASGDVVSFGGARWFFQNGRDRLEPGDSVVVPFNIKVGDPLYILTSVSQILFNMATTVLAVDSVRN